MTAHGFFSLTSIPANSPRSEPDGWGVNCWFSDRRPGASLQGLADHRAGDAGGVAGLHRVPGNGRGGEQVADPDRVSGGVHPTEDLAHQGQRHPPALVDVVGRVQDDAGRVPAGPRDHADYPGVVLLLAQPQTTGLVEHHHTAWLDRVQRVDPAAGVAGKIKVLGVVGAREHQVTGDDDVAVEEPRQAVRVVT